MTHRQFQAWTAWLRMQWNEPDRGDWYAMQVAAEVRAVLGKRPDIKSLKLPFQLGQQSMTDAEAKKKRDRADAAAKAKWMPMLGVDDGKPSGLRDLVMRKKREGLL